MFRREIVIFVEQAVYGSFAFWDRGYAILARSAGCRDEWLSEWKQICQRLGEPRQGASDVPWFFATQLSSGPWAIVAVIPQGTDDRGRPGALAFHALFVKSSDYRRAGSNPFAFIKVHRYDWGLESDRLEPVRISIEHRPNKANGPSSQARQIVRYLVNRRRVLVPADSPIEALSRDVWSALPEHLRRRASVATYAYSLDQQFDLVAMPESLATLAHEREPYYILFRESLEVAHPQASSSFVFARPKGHLILVVAIVSALAALLLAWALSSSVKPKSASLAPPLERAADSRIDPETRQRIAEALADFADRFGARSPSFPAVNASDADLGGQLARISDQLRYHGRLLSQNERLGLQADSSSEAGRALAWDQHIHLFLPDRPVAGNFTSGPLGWRLRALAWSFHLDDRVGFLPPAEIAPSVSDALAIDVSTRKNMLSKRYPVLDDYERFLRRLPRR